jgi:DNA mismatch endonuclease, patch repair protein
MSRIRRRDTKPELALRRAVWARGLRGYRIDSRKLPGRPDLSWGRSKVAVFVDGAFWHGHPSAFTRGKSGAYWDEKIARNVARDRVADRALREMGWIVIRLWDFEVGRELDRCVKVVADAVSSRSEEQADRPDRIETSGLVSRA